MTKIKLKRLWQKIKANLINQESNTKYFTVSRKFEFWPKSEYKIIKGNEMAIKQSEVKRILLLDSFCYNAFLFFYPSMIFLIFLLLKKYNILSINILDSYSSFIPLWAVWKFFLFFLLLPLCLSLIIAPLVSLFTTAIETIPNGLISNIFLLTFLPFNIFCCLFIFIGSFCHFFISLIWSKVQFVDDPHLFQWSTYVFILKPVINNN